jgi:hypothetical protein
MVEAGSRVYIICENQYNYYKYYTSIAYYYYY